MREHSAGGTIGDHKNRAYFVSPWLLGGRVNIAHSFTEVVVFNQGWIPILVIRFSIRCSDLDLHFVFTRPRHRFLLAMGGDIRFTLHGPAARVAAKSLLGRVRGGTACRNERSFVER